MYARMIRISTILSGLGMMLAAFPVPGAFADTVPPPQATSVAPIAVPPQATPLPALTPDRPGFTNGSDIVLPHRTQVEVGMAQTRASSANGGAITNDYPEALICTGLTPKLELRIGLPDYANQPGTASGFGDASLGVKYKVYQSKDGNTKAALTPAVTIPTGKTGFTSGHVDPLLTLGAQTISGARWGISANLALSDPTQNGSRVFTVAPSAAASYQITGALSAYGELYDNIPKTGATSPIADGGFTYLVNPNLQFDIETGAGLATGAPTRFFGGGVSVRF